MKLKNIIEKLKLLFQNNNEIPALKIYNFKKLEDFQQIFNPYNFDNTKFEKLEFIGDRLINFIIANILIEKYPNRIFYSNFRNTVFSNSFFEKIISANKIRKLYDYNKINRNAGDVLECLCAMTYYKEGFKKTYKIFKKLIEPTLKREARFINEKHWYFIFRKLCQDCKISFNINTILKENKELFQATLEIQLIRKKKTWFGFSPDKIDAEEAVYQQAYRWLIKYYEPCKIKKKDKQNG